MKPLAITVYVAVFVVLSVPSETAKLEPALNLNLCNQAAKFAAGEIQVPLGPQKWILTTKCKQALQFGYEPGFASTEFPKYTLEFRRKSPLSWVDYESCNAVVEYYWLLPDSFVLISGSCNI